MTKVWLVTTGSYSDYRLDSVWASEELAEQFMASADHRFNDPEIFEVMTAVPERITIHSMQAFIRDAAVFGESDLRTITEWSGRDTKREVPARAELGEVQHLHGLYGTGAGHQINIYVYGTDLARIQKVYSETKARVIATFDLLVGVCEHLSLPS